MNSPNKGSCVFDSFYISELLGGIGYSYNSPWDSVFKLRANLLGQVGGVFYGLDLDDGGKQFLNRNV